MRKHTHRLATTAFAASAAVASLGTALSPAASAGVGTRTQVPWSSVGNGWVVANSIKAGVNTLILVAPSGQSYVIATLAKDESVVGISHDGRSALTSVGTQGSKIWNLTTGKATASLPRGDYVFTRPNGSAVMGVVGDGDYARYSLTGQRRAYVKGVHVTNIKASPSGTIDAAEHGGSIQVRTHGTFALQRTLAAPSGYENCRLIAWANPTTITEACFSTSGETQQVFAQPTNGGKPTVMTSGTAPGMNDALGWQDAVDTSAGRIGVPAIKEAPDFVTEVWKMSGTKPSSKISLPDFNPHGGEYAHFGAIQEIVGTKVFRASAPLGEDSPLKTVAQYDVVTKKTNYLVGKDSQFGGTYISYAVIDPRD